MRIGQIIRFLFYPLPMLIILSIVCLTGALHADGVSPMRIIAIDLIPLLVPVVIIYYIIFTVKLRAHSEFRENPPKPPEDWDSKS